MTKWWRRFNTAEGGYEKYHTGMLTAIASSAAIFAGFIVIGWL